MTKLKIFSVIMLLLFNIWGANSTPIDSTKINTKTFFKKSILPASLIVVGSLISNSKFEKTLQTDLRNKIGNDYENKIDNYIVFAPIAEMYLADILGVKSKNHWFDQSKYLFISNLISSTITYRLKVMTNKERPSGGNNHSFPSGHTTLGFTNASVLYQEFKDSSPVLAYSGFAFATATGGFRMLNNKHYISDVLVGAGIGILVTELVYYIEPFKRFNPFKKSKNISFSPVFIEDKYGFYFSCKF